MAFNINVNCNNCHNSEFAKIGNKIFHNILTKSETMDFHVKLVCCSKCGMVFQNPIQSEKKLQKYYSSMFREEGCRPVKHIKKEFENRVSNIIDMRKKLKFSKILEIGCADGTTLSMLKKEGLSVFGIEPSESNAKLCKEKNLKVFNGTYENFPTKEGKFDIITSYYVMEHLRKPLNFLKFCNKMLAKGGAICIEIPDIDSYKKEETFSDLLYFFEHQHHFTKKTIKILLELCGFKLIKFFKPTHNFGMGFFAKKILEPITPNELSIDQKQFKQVMNSIKDYKEFYSRKLTALKNKLSFIFSTDSKNNVVLFPAGSFTKQLLELQEINHKSIKFIIDNNPDKWNSTMFGIPIYPPSKLDHTVKKIVIASSFKKELVEQLIGLGYKKSKIISL